MLNLERAFLIDLACDTPLGRLLFCVDNFDEEFPEGGPRTVLLRGEQLARLKALYAAGDGRIVEIVDAMRGAADLAMDTALPAVTDKGEVPGERSPHDYVSLAKYWWPVETPRASGSRVRYENRDGEVNPECYEDRFDYSRLVSMTGSAFTLALAGYLTGENRYSVRAAEFLRRWFLDPETWQAPSFEFAQEIPGKTSLRSAGIVEARLFLSVCEAVEILAAAGALGESEIKEMRSWFGKFLEWLLESPQGKHAGRAKNNIAFWYYTQCYIYALFCGDHATAGWAIQSTAKAIRDQIATDGQMPAEMRRAKPEDYVAFSLVSLAMMEAAASNSGIRAPEVDEEAGRALNAARTWLRKTAAATDIRSALKRLGPDIGDGSPLAPSELALTARLLETVDQKLGDIPNGSRSLRDEGEVNKAPDVPLGSETGTGREGVEGQGGRVEDLERELAAVRTRNADLTRKLDRKRRLVRTLAIPYLVLTFPVSLPLLLLRDRKRRKQKNRSKSSGFTLLQGLESLPRKRPEEVYEPSDIDDAPDRVVLCRIIGNDLVPRHSKGQSYANLSFILENEPDFENCEKLFIVNRIFDAGERDRIVTLLTQHGSDFIEVPFDAAEYRAIGWDLAALPRTDYFVSEDFRNLDPQQRSRALTAVYRLKNLYLMHSNSARNLALEAGAKRAKWVLPWDGNCFLTQRGWEAMHRKLVANGRFRYFAVPMQRVAENAMLLSDDFAPDPQEEPQLIFRQDAKERFNEAFPYGRRPKVELFWRLGIPGGWDNWRDDPWEQKRRPAGEEHGCVEVAGWVARLASGVQHLERQKDVESFRNRGLVRNEAIMAAIDLADARLNPLRDTGLYPEEALNRLRAALDSGSGDGLAAARALIDLADEAVTQGPFSVADKTTLPPSRDRKDYWHPAPYWWPDPKKRDGLPYVKIDGQRVPGTVMYSPESEQFDRTRLQLMFDNTAILALAAGCTGRSDYADHAARLVRTWFLEPETRMNPHLNYAQVRRGWNKDKGFKSGIIEFKDLYFFLPCVAGLVKKGALSANEEGALKEWFETYQDWLETSSQGRKEAAEANNHGTYFDLQAAAIAIYLGDHDRLRKIYLRAQSRLFDQIDGSGVQPHEMKRTLTQHYAHFNLQGFLHLFRITASHGFPVPDSDGMPGRRIESALRWILAQDTRNWPYQQIEPFDADRTTALVAAARRLGFLCDWPQDRDEVLNAKCRFDPHAGIRPLWNVGDAL